MVGKIQLSKHSKKRLIHKQCQFPGCTEWFDGIGPSRYCAKHRTPAARLHMSKLYATKRKIAQNPVDDVNQVIVHKFLSIAQRECECALDGCSNRFTIQILPHVSVYPKYCAEHRTEWRRQWFLQQQTSVLGTQ